MPVANYLPEILETTEAERLATGFVFTEGPLWHPDGYWYFVDIRQNKLYRMTPGRAPEVVRETAGGNGTTFDLQGNLKSGLWSLISGAPTRFGFATGEVREIFTKDTIEEEILKLHETKRDLVAGILDGTHSAAKLSTERGFPPSLLRRIFLPLFRLCCFDFLMDFEAELRRMVLRIRERVI